VPLELVGERLVIDELRYHSEPEYQYPLDRTR
jgi:hypothetical protein